VNGTFVGTGTGYKKAAAEAAAAEDTAHKLSWAPAFRCKLIFVFLFIVE
jgi:dsRNA-specific ribonuclease